MFLSQLMSVILGDEYNELDSVLHILFINDNITLYTINNCNYTIPVYNKKRPSFATFQCLEEQT